MGGGGDERFELLGCGGGRRVVDDEEGLSFL